jgi:hypothetical protein
MAETVVAAAIFREPNSRKGPVFVAVALKWAQPQARPYKLAGR